jgi:putative GTP pyrophosphokinase
VCSFHDDIYRLADCLLQQDDIFLVERKDYIVNPKESGYRSLHLIVQVPIFLENEKRCTRPRNDGYPQMHYRVCQEK